MKISAVKTFNLTFKAISQSLEKLQKEIDTDQLDDFIKVLVGAFHSGRKVFVYGAGRSLLVGKAFSMRLMHLGFRSYVIGEVVTPAVSANDIFLVISKTLSEESLFMAIETAKKFEARIIMMTSVEGNSILKKVDNLILVPDLKSTMVRMHGANTPLGTLFEISTMVLLDCAVAELMYRLGITEEEMEKRHANIQ